MNTMYEKDVVAWANEQARFIRAGNWSAIDIENLAEEIEDVGRSEQRELVSRMSVLLAHLLKWKYQPNKRSRSWTNTINNQRERIAIAVRKTPSLKGSLADEDWQREAWLDAIGQAQNDTGLDNFPDVCPWQIDQVLSVDWLPS